MTIPTRLTNGKPYDIHLRLLVFGCDIVFAAQFLHNQGGIARAISYQLVSSGMSAGANAAEGDSATSHDDFIAKTRIALREAKETRFRLRVCRRVGLLDARFESLTDECDQLVRILGKIVHTAIKNREARKRNNRKQTTTRSAN